MHVDVEVNRQEKGETIVALTHISDALYFFAN
jgi:hypothetical protein